jgi:hypothetical protein
MEQRSHAYDNREKAPGRHARRSGSQVRLARRDSRQLAKGRAAEGTRLRSSILA